MTWLLTWLNVSVATLNATLQLLVIYWLIDEGRFIWNPIRWVFYPRIWTCICIYIWVKNVTWVELWHSDVIIQIINYEHNQSYCDWWKQFILLTFFPFSFVCLCNRTWFLMYTLRSVLFRTSVKFLAGLLKSACLFDRIMAMPLHGMIQQALISCMLVSTM